MRFWLVFMTHETDFHQVGGVRIEKRADQQCSGHIRTTVERLFYRKGKNPDSTVARTYCAMTISDVLLTLIVEIFTNGTKNGTEYVT